MSSLRTTALMLYLSTPLLITSNPIICFPYKNPNSSIPLLTLKCCSNKSTRSSQNLIQMIFMLIKDKMRESMNPSKLRLYSVLIKPFSQSCSFPKRIHSKIVYLTSLLKLIGSWVSHTSSMKIRPKERKPRIRLMKMNKYLLQTWLLPQIHLHFIKVSNSLINY